MSKNKKENTKNGSDIVEEKNEQEDVTQNKITKVNNNGYKLTIAIMGVVLVVLLTLLLIVLLGGKDNKSDNKGEQSKQEERQDDKEDNEQEEDDQNSIKVNVKNINSDKTYSIKLLKKEQDNPDGKYVYAFYDSTNKRMITDYEYSNATCGFSCSDNPSTIGCIEKNVSAYSFNVSNTDYIYVTYDVNLCGGIDSSYFIYNTSDYSVEKGNGGRNSVDNVDGEIVISYRNAADDICGALGAEQLNCYEPAGYIFSKNGTFDIIKGVGSFKVGNNYAIVHYSRETDANTFVIKIYNAKGEVVSTFNNCVAYNEKYVVVIENKNLIVYDINNNKKGIIDSVKFEIDKYYYNPILVESNDKIQLKYISKSDESGHTVDFSK